MQILLEERNNQSFLFCWAENDKKYGRVSSKALKSFALALAQSISMMMLFSTTGNRNIKVHLVLDIRMNAYFTTETYFLKSAMYLTKNIIKLYHPNNLGGGRKKGTGRSHISPLQWLDFTVFITAEILPLTSS